MSQQKRVERHLEPGERLLGGGFGLQNYTELMRVLPSLRLNANGAWVYITDRRVIAEWTKKKVMSWRHSEISNLRFEGHRLTKHLRFDTAAGPLSFTYQFSVLKLHQASNLARAVQVANASRRAAA